MLPAEIQSLVSRGALFVVNHSGGKDSQAMFAYLYGQVPKDQMVVVHAILPEVEWDGVEEHVRANVFDVPVRVCQARRSLLQMIEERGMVPSPSQRQCTSDLKRGPIEKVVRALVKERLAAGKVGANIIVNCMGMRAQESDSRSKLAPFKFSARNSLAGREWYDWLPIFDWKVEEVFAQIARIGQTPHWAYAAGMSRLSCCFCIMSSKADLVTAARLNPVLYKKYVELEKSTGQVMLMPQSRKGQAPLRLSLEQVTGVLAA